MTTTQPTNASEWQLYRVLQRANLLQYYDTFVAQGGDDVQQLCEAGEEEFLEIMALVGMASKPLHVRRLQKALQEWVANPAAFQGNGNSAIFKREPPTQVFSLPAGGAERLSPTPWAVQSTPQKSVSPVSMVEASRTELQPEISTCLEIICLRLLETSHYETPVPSQIKKSSSPVPSPFGQPLLSEIQINDIAKCAAKLATQLPYFEPKPLNMKKDVNKQIIEILNTDKELVDRLELMRKYGAIYRRFDSQRTYGKPMSMHEICVNEASAQLCYHMPSLLTRREDLFPLARQVVKDSGYQYSKGHSRAGELCPNNPSKRQKLDFLASVPGLGQSEAERAEREERLKAISKELSEIAQKQEQIVLELDGVKDSQNTDKAESLQLQLEQITNKHLQLLTEQSDLLRKQSFEVYDIDMSSDREDSSLGPSGSNSPAQVDRPDSSQHVALKAALASSINSSASGMKNTLFDEGIRIAQQYGMCEFANELKCLQGTDGDEDQEEQLEVVHSSRGDKNVNQNGHQGHTNSIKRKDLTDGKSAGNAPEGSEEEPNNDISNDHDVSSHSPHSSEIENGL